MEGNVLTAAATPARPGPQPEQQRVVQLVSNSPPNKIVGLDGFLKLFNTKSVRAEATAFRYVIQRKSRRSLGGKFGRGLSHEVTENIEVNPNEDLFGLRRWLGGIRQDPSCVMLLNVNKVRDEALAAPLIFSEMLRTGRPILVTGAPPETQDQLFAQIDPTFQSIPLTIQGNTSLKTSLLQRVLRRKGFVNTVRPVLDLEGLPPALVPKLQAINAGQDSKLSDAEVINACLLGDLASRYLPSIVQFREAMRNSSLQMPQLVSMFEILTSDMPLAQAVEAFKSFFTEEAKQDPGRLKSRAAVFSEAYRGLTGQEAGTKGGSRTDRMDEFFRKLTGVVVQFRARTDPQLWRRCYFLGDTDPLEREMADRLLPFHALLATRIESSAADAEPEFLIKMGEAIFDLVEVANQKPEAAGSERGLLRQASAARLLPLFRMNKFAASNLVQISEQNRATLLDKEKFLSLFRKIPVSLDELRELEQRLYAALYVNEHVSNEVRKSTLDVMLGYAKERDRRLREIYILNAVPELVKYNFHLGERSLSPIERMTAFAIGQNRLGLELRTEPAVAQSVGLFVLPDEPPLGNLANDPQLVSQAYTTLVGLQVERLVRRAVDHKINYLQSTFGDNFFEVIYGLVVDRNDLPLSRNQLAWYVQRHSLLGNLQAKGWKREEENELDDDFILVERPAAPGTAVQTPKKDFSGFAQRFADLSRQFAELHERLKKSAAEDPREDNPAVLIWQMYQAGIYNLSRDDARELFRKSVFYSYLKDIIAQISSENYSVFTREIQQEGVRIYVPRAFYHLLSIGSRFSFLIADKVVRYQLIASPTESNEQLDTLSRVFVEKLEEQLAGAKPLPDAIALKAIGEEIQLCNKLWWDYSRHLAFALVDRVLTRTIIAELQPGAILPNNLWYLPDETKLCLGPTIAASDLVPFQKLLQVPENMGNIQKNPKSSSTTIDDFTIEVHKIGRVADELENMASIAEDVLDILQNLTHARTESALVQKYEQNLAKLNEALAIPLRHFREKEVQLLHQLARGIRETLQAFYQTPGSTKDQFVGLLQSQLRARRSDGHQLKLSFTDTFILETTEIRVMQKVKKNGGEIVARQKKMEVEVDQVYQTIATRIRDVIHTHELLERKDHIILQPEGQKKKQIEYVLDIIDTLMALRGNALTFYCDMTMLDDGQVQDLATRIKPHNFFKMDELKNEPPKGMAARSKDPLSGRPLPAPKAAGAKPAPARPAASAVPAPPAAQAPSAAPAAPAAPSGGPSATQDPVFTSRTNPAIRYRLDAAQGQYYFLDAAGPVPVRALSVTLADGERGTILLGKLPSGKFVCHGLHAGNVLSPLSQKPAPPVICSFAFPSNTVRVVNDGGKPAVRVEEA